jgi:hypothetical protein
MMKSRGGSPQFKQPNHDKEPLLIPSREGFQPSSDLIKTGLFLFLHGTISGVKRSTVKLFANLFKSFKNRQRRFCGTSSTETETSLIFAKQIAST